MHLFDIDVPGKIRFQESETLSPGNELLTFDTGDPPLLSFNMSWNTLTHFSVAEWCKIGVAICYDLRFQEMAALYSQKGTSMHAWQCNPIHHGAFSCMKGGVTECRCLKRSKCCNNTVRGCRIYVSEWCYMYLQL